MELVTRDMWLVNWLLIAGGWRLVADGWSLDIGIRVLGFSPWPFVLGPSSFVRHRSSVFRPLLASSLFPHYNLFPFPVFHGGHNASSPYRAFFLSACSPHHAPLRQARRTFGHCGSPRRTAPASGGHLAFGRRRAVHRFLSDGVGAVRVAAAEAGAPPAHHGRPPRGSVRVPVRPGRC